MGNTITLQELEQACERMREHGATDDTPVLVAYQPSYPLQVAFSALVYHQGENRVYAVGTSAPWDLNPYAPRVVFGADNGDVVPEDGEE